MQLQEIKISSINLSLLRLVILIDKNKENNSPLFLLDIQTVASKYIEKTKLSQDLI